MFSHPVNSDLIQKLRQAKKVAMRLEIAALTAEQKTPSEISRQLNISRPTVYRWQRRYQEKGLQALSKDLPRSGRKTTFGAKQEQMVVQLANKTTRHNIGSIAESSGLSYGITRRILLRNNLKVQRKNEPLNRNLILKNKKKNSISSITRNSTITQKELGTECGLSQSTVSLALRSSPLPKSETRLKIQEAARKLDYIPTPSSSALANLRWQQRPRFTNVALLAPAHTRKSSQAIYAHLLKQAKSRGYSIHIIPFEEETPLEKLDYNLQQRGIQAVILGTNFYKSMVPRIKKALQWERFTALSLSPGVAWLNRIEITNYSQRVRRCMNEAVDKNYKHISFLDLSQTAPIQPIYEKWNPVEIALEIHFQKMYHRLHSNNQSPPLILHSNNQKEQIAQLANYLQKYSPELILCDQDAGYSLLQKASASKGLPLPAFISLNKQNKQDKKIAGLIVDKQKDQVELIIQCLDKQIRNNERGIPGLPIKYLPPPYAWEQGSSLTPKAKFKLNAQKHLKRSHSANTSLHKEDNVFETLDFKKRFNCSTAIRDQWSGDKTFHITPGKHYFNQVPFKILPGDNLSQPNALMMRSSKSQTQSTLPEQITLPLNGHCKRGHLLHTCLWVGFSQLFASYQFIYDDNTISTLPLCSYGQERFTSQEIGLNSSVSEHQKDIKPNIGDWYPYYEIKPEDLQTGACPFELPNEQIDSPRKSDYLFTLAWENPHPEKALKALRIQSDINQKTTLAVLAVTLEK